jgi:dienelactone hydrolase
MELQELEVQVAGRTFRGALADGSGGRRVPGVLVAHEGGGLSAHERERAVWLAELGTVAFALDYFGLPKWELEEAKAIVRALRADPARIREHGNAALRVLATHAHVDPSRLAALGFCFGGRLVLELARGGAPLACTIGFHAELVTATPADARSICGKVLVCLGADDPIVDEAQRAAFRAEMSTAGVDWQMHLYGGAGHSFTNRHIDAHRYPGFAYHREADQRSWAAARALLEEVFAPRTG